MLEKEIGLEATKYFDSLMEYAENSSQSEQDSILLAGAMMGVAKVLYQKYIKYYTYVIRNTTNTTPTSSEIQQIT